MESLMVFPSTSYPPSVDPGARAAGGLAERGEPQREVLPLGARPSRVGAASDRVWVLRLPVRAERVVVEKQVVVAEEVALRVRQVEEVQHVEDTVAREHLRVTRSPNLEPTQPVDISSTDRSPNL